MQHAFITNLAAHAWMDAHVVLISSVHMYAYASYYTPWVSSTDLAIHRAARDIFFANIEIRSAFYDGEANEPQTEVRMVCIHVGRC